jgi:hypothetical protein
MVVFHFKFFFYLDYETIGTASGDNEDDCGEHDGM